LNKINCKVLEGTFSVDGQMPHYYLYIYMYSFGWNSLDSLDWGNTGVAAVSYGGRG